MGEIVAALLLWIGAHTSYTVTDIPLPEVRFVSARAMTEEYYRDAPLSYARPEVDDRVLALYDMESTPNGVIYMLEGQQLDDPLFQERLLHELVHHVQNVNGMFERYRCHAEGEREAYKLGGRFLKERGIPDPLPNRNFWAAMYSRC